MPKLDLMHAGDKALRLGNRAHLLALMQHCAGSRIEMDRRCTSHDTEIERLIDSHKRGRVTGMLHHDRPWLPAMPHLLRLLRKHIKRHQRSRIFGLWTRVGTVRLGVEGLLVRIGRLPPAWKKGD